MDVGLVYSRYPPSVGGAETQLHLVARGLVADQGCAVRVVTPVNDQGNADPYRIGVLAPKISAYELDGVQVHGLSPSPCQRLRALPTLVYYLPRLRRWFYKRLLRVGIRRYTRVFGPHIAHLFEGVDVIHSVALNHLGWAAHDAARRLGVPFVLKPLVHPGQYGDDEINLELIRKADAVIALVETEKAFYVDQGVTPDKIEVIGIAPLLNGQADPEQFRRDHGLSGPLIAFLGRQTAYKGVPELVEAVRRLAVTRPDIRLALAGPPDDSFRLSGNGSVIDLGLIDEPTKQSLLTACDIFCLPSRHEILPSAILEAWSLGKPVIAGDTPYLRSLVAHEQTGWIVSHTADAIADAIQLLLDQPDLARRLGEAGRQRVASSFAPEVIVARTGQLLAQMARTAQE